MAKHNVVHKYLGSYDRHEEHHTAWEDEACRRLAAVILLQATSDYITLLNHEAKCRKEGIDEMPYNTQIGSYKELSDFVRTTRLGHICCGLVGLEPEIIVERYAKWKRTFDKTGAIPTQVYKVGVIETIDNSDRCARYRERMRRQEKYPPCRYDKKWEVKK